MPGKTSAIGLSITQEAAAYRLSGGLTTQHELYLNGADLEVTGGDVQLVAQQNTAVTLPDLAAAQLLAFETLTAAGSLLTSDGTDPIELPIGTNGQYLRVNTANPSKLEYATLQSIAVASVNASAQMVAGTAYIVDDAAAALVELTLPDGATTALGETVIIYGGNSANKWKIVQNAGDQIRSLNIATTAGVTGSLDSLENNDSIELKHRGSGIWQVADCVGTFQLN